MVIKNLLYLKIKEESLESINSSEDLTVEKNLSLSAEQMGQFLFDISLSISFLSHYILEIIIII